MEIQEDVELEWSDDPEADVSVSMRAATSIPRYTEEELKVGLGEEVDRRMGSLLSRLAVVAED